MYDGVLDFFMNQPEYITVSLNKALHKTPLILLFYTVIELVVIHSLRSNYYSQLKLNQLVSNV